jgi:hypothetical protein
LHILAARPCVRICHLSAADIVFRLLILEEDTSRFLEEATPWERLSQAYFGTSSQFQGHLFDFSFDHQKAQDSQKLIDFSIKKFLIFPDHLISELQRYQPIVPFKFYTDVLFRVMATDRADQTIPNFTAADTLRVLVGISSLINKSRAGGVSTILQSSGPHTSGSTPRKRRRSKSGSLRRVTFRGCTTNL